MGLDLGTVLSGKYRLDSLLGQGGMGEVFAATDLDTDEVVAVKVMHMGIADDVLLARLQREAQAVRRVQSDFIPRLFDVGRAEQGAPFLVMQRLYGESLADRLDSRQYLFWPEAATVVEDILRGLVDAHTAGVIHRDLKPGNIFLVQDDAGNERAMLLDFGVCKIDAHDPKALTATGEAIGTVAYMAPEQIRSAAKLDERADLYAVGMVVYEMVSGRLPFDEQGQVALLAAKLEKNPIPLRDLHRAAVPPGLDMFVMKALSKKPQDRFASAQEMLKAFRGLGPPTRAPRPASSRSLPTLPQAQTESNMATGQSAGPTPRPVSRAKLWAIAVGFGALVGVGIGIMAVVGRYRSAPAVTPDDLAALPPPASAAPVVPSGSTPEPIASSSAAPSSATALESDADAGVLEIEFGETVSPSNGGHSRPRPASSSSKPPPKGHPAAVPMDKPRF